MKKLFGHRSLFVVAIASIALLAVALSACGDDSKDDTANSKSAQNADAISAIDIIDKAGLHDIDTSISTDGKVPATAQTTATHLQAVALLTDWPTQQLKDDAKKLADVFGTLADSLNSSTPDLKKAGEAAHNAHEAQHDFSKEVWTYLQGEAGIKAGATATD